MQTNHLTGFATLVLVLCVFALGAMRLHAQPSGGPYGPMDRRYEVPKAAHVYYVSADGKADAGGTLDQPTTIESAIDRVVTGDAIILRGGVYRERSFDNISKHYPTSDVDRTRGGF